MSSYHQRLRARVVDRYKRVFVPRPKESILEWARKNIHLSKKESGDFPGPYDPDLNPLPTIILDVAKSGKYRRIAVKKSSQSGVTLIILILICYYISFVCRNFLYVIDSKDEMRRISKERLKPMIKKCAGLQAQITPDPDDFSNLTLSLKGCTGYLCGSNSMGTLANKSVGLAINDEPDTYKDKTAVRRTADRGKKQSSFLHILLSKPENWRDTINQEYLIGTRHRFHYPCPHCHAAGRNTWMTVSGFEDWKKIKYDHCRDLTKSYDFDRMKTEIFLECIDEACRQEHPEGIAETYKPWMIARRDARQTNFNQDEYKLVPDVFSIEIDDLMSTFPTCTWSILAQEWIEAQSDEGKMKEFVRGRCATAWKEKVVEVADADIYEMRGAYARGHCPVEPWLVLMGVDRQMIVKKWVKTAFLKDGTAYVVDYGETLSDADIIREADNPVIVDRWNDDTPPERQINPVVYKGICDEGYEQVLVRDFVVSTFLQWMQMPNGQMVPDYRFYSAWGQGGIHSKSLRDLVIPTAGEKPNAVHNNLPIYAYRFSDDNFKADLYNQRIKRDHEIRAAERDGRPLPQLKRLRFPADIDKGFVDELCQEKFGEDPKTKRFKWLECSGNDYGDGLKLCMVGFYILGPFALMSSVTSAQPPHAYLLRPSNAPTASTNTA